MSYDFCRVFGGLVYPFICAAIRGVYQMIVVCKSALAWAGKKMIVMVMRPLGSAEIVHGGRDRAAGVADRFLRGEIRYGQIGAFGGIL